MTEQIAKRDSNRVPTLIGVDSVGFTDPTTIAVNPTTHAVLTSGSATLAGDSIPVAGATTAVSVQIVDGSGNQVASFGGGVQYTEGDTDASVTGTAAMMEGAANTLLPIQGTVADGLLVNLGTNNDVAVTGSVTATQATGSNLHVVVDTAPTTAVTFTGSTDVATQTTLALIKAKTDNIPALGQALAAASVPVILPSATITTLTPPAAITGFATETTLGLVNAKLVSGTDIGDVTINNASGASAVNIQDGGNTITVDGTVTVGSITAGNNNIGDVDVASIAAGDNNIGNVDIVSGTITTVTTLTGGGIAHDAADSGNPVKVGAQARTTNPTAVADADRSNLITDDLGKLVVVGSIRDLKANQITTITSSTSETTVVTAVASTFMDVYGCIVVNSSATAANVSFKDSTAGTTRFNIYVPAGETRGFMLNESAAIAQTTVNNNWTATSSASVASLVITMLTVKNI